MQRSLSLRAAAAVLVAAFVGCEAQHATPDTLPASGTVTLDGKPLASGTVMYEAVDGAALGLAPASGTIADGKYEIRAAAGKHRVRISSVQETGKTDATGAPEMLEVIPEKYNAATELTAEVAPGSPNAETFDLSSKRPAGSTR